MVSRRTVLAAATVAASVGTVLARGVGGASAAALATVSVDLAAPEGPFPFGLGGQLSATPKSWRYSAATTAKLDALHLRMARVWLKYPELAASPDMGNDYLEYYHQRADSLLLNWQTGYAAASTAPGFDLEAFVVAQADMLARLKKRYPKIEFIEAENEDFASGQAVGAYYAKYQVVYRAVKMVNDLWLSQGQLRVGGPVIDVFSESRLGQFFDAFRADSRPEKRLDFVSYHQYLINTTGSGNWDAVKDNPKVVASERKKIHDMLLARGLEPRAIMVSEVGIFPGTRASNLGLNEDFHLQAAGVASLHYWYAQQVGITPFDWTVDHPENDRKDLFVSTETGVPRPYYNALRALSMLPPTRCPATSDSLSDRGIGVYGLAGASQDEVAVLTWNYQWTNRTAFDSRIKLTGFPAAFRENQVRVTRYRIARTVHDEELKPVHTFLVPPRTDGGYVSETYPLEPNELRLLVLTPER